MKSAIKITLSVAVVSFFAFIAFASGGSNSEKKVECNSSSEGYRTGYEVGKNSIWSDPETHKRECNNGAGMFGKVPECWNEGFIDGHNNK